MNILQSSEACINDLIKQRDNIDELIHSVPKFARYIDELYDARNAIDDAITNVKTFQKNTL